MIPEDALATLRRQVGEAFKAGTEVFPRYHFANEAPDWRSWELIFDPEPGAERELDLAELNPIRGPVALLQYWDEGDLPGAGWRLLRLAFLHLKQSDPARALAVLEQIDIDHQPRG